MLPANDSKGASFRILKPDSPEWTTLFERLPHVQQDVFYSPAFARLCQLTLNKDDEVLCAAMISDAMLVVYPFVKRDLGRLTGFSGCAEIYDITIYK